MKQMQRIYLDNASTTPLLPSVIKVMKESLEADYGNPSSIHAIGRTSRSKIEAVRKNVAHHIEASVGEIFFTSSATEANNTILRRCVVDLGVRHIITCQTEHHCILHTCESLIAEYADLNVTYLPVDAKGHIDYNHLTHLCQHTSVPTCVSLMMVNNEIGTLHDIKKIGEICKENGVLYHCDAVQGIGKYPLSVSLQYFSFLSASAHKFHGPKGVGFMYINNENIVKPMIYGGAQERNMRAGTENLLGIIGMGKALDEAIANMTERQEHITNLRNKFISLLKEEIPGCKVNGDEEGGAYHILSVSFPPSDTGDMLIFNLDISGICASSGSACSSGIEADSHVLMAIGHPSDRKSVRFSFGIQNTEDEIKETIAVLKKHTLAKSLSNG